MESNSRKLYIALGIATCIVIFLFAWVSFNEWFTVNVEAEAPVVESYYFGEEHTIRNKGWHYSSADQYAKVNFIQGISLLLIFLIAGIGFFRKNYFWIPFSICLLVLNFFFWRWLLSFPEFPF